MPGNGYYEGVWMLWRVYNAYKKSWTFWAVSNGICDHSTTFSSIFPIIQKIFLTPWFLGSRTALISQTLKPLIWMLLFNLNMPRTVLWLHMFHACLNCSQGLERPYRLNSQGSTLSFFPSPLTTCVIDISHCYLRLYPGGTHPVIERELPKFGHCGTLRKS